MTSQPHKRPNILLTTSEDNGPQLGFYGATYLRPPNLDRLGDDAVLQQLTAKHDRASEQNYRRGRSFRWDSLDLLLKKDAMTDDVVLPHPRIVNWQAPCQRRTTELKKRSDRWTQD